MDNGNNFPFKGPTVDLNKVAALNQRRSVTFMNNFLISTSNFLNNFSVIAEENITKQTLEMQKLEIAVNILESKLDSIPGLGDVISQSRTSNSDAGNIEEKNASASQLPPEVSTASMVANVVLVKDDPRYTKFFKMKNVGVPTSAIASKMRAEGLDPDLLDTPDAPVSDPPGGDDSEDTESMSSSCGFSD